jgi:DedD protein
VFRVSDNDNLELKKRSRRRLVGAATLALIAAIVLPMVMDDEPVNPVRDIQVTIPEQTVNARPIGSREPIPEPVADDSSLVQPEAVRAPEAEQAARPVEPAPSTLQPEAVPAPAPKPVPVPPTESQESSEAQRARAILEGRGSQPVTAPTTQFLVQVGAFSDPSKAQQRQVELAARGFKAFIETSDGVSRVRLGPFPSRTDAEAMIARLRAASFDGVVTTR